MFNQGGLSLEQAPPISVVLRFFVTAAIFGTLLGLYLIALFSGLIPYSEQHEHPVNLTIIHLLALGVMASFMLGALFQMLPVIAGVIIKTPSKKAMVAHILLVVGLLLQLLAFNSESVSLLYLFSAIVLGSGLLHASILMLKQIIKIKDHSSSSKGMLFALSSFSISILFGVYLLLTLGGYIDGTFFVEVKEAHYSFALFGWVTLLIISISFQVVEMFYITPKYPTIMSRYLVGTIFILLVVKTILLFTNLNSSIINILLATLFIIYAGITLHRLSKRKRPTSDATVWFWRLGMGLLMLSMLNYLIVLSAPIYLGIVENLSTSIFFDISYISFIGFALSIVFAMIYKIVPFLVWFHLSNQGYIEAPMMHEVIHPKKAKIHFKIHITMMLLLFFSFIFEFQFLTILAMILIMISFGWLLYLLIFAVRKYNYTQKHTEKMEW